MRFAFLLACIATTMSAREYNPLPDPASVVLSPSGNARFTLLSPLLLRLQYAPDGNFSDAPTLAVVNRALPVPPFNQSYDKASGVLTIRTGTLTLAFTDGPPSPPRNCPPASWEPGTDAGLPRVRSRAFPNGTSAADVTVCCALCAGALDCAGFVYDSSKHLCYPLASFNGTIPANGRTFGALSLGGFTPSNLRIATGVLPGGGSAAWVPGDKQAYNLGGTLQQMDCYTTPAECFALYGEQLAEAPGLLARDGWTLLDDSAGTLRTPPRPTDGTRWWAPPSPGHTDWYFAAYGDDYRGALGAFQSVMGAPELPPRALLGVAWSQNYPWTNATGNSSIVTGVLDNYASPPPSPSFPLPLSLLVLDMDWHKRHYPEDPKACETWGSWDFNTTSAFPDPLGFLQWLGGSGNPLGHPLATSLNVHPQTGAYHCLERYAAFAAAAGASTAGNATVPCDMASQAFVDALWGVYYTQPPLSSVSVMWTDYTGCDSGQQGAPPSLLWSNLVYAERRAVAAAAAAEVVVTEGKSVTPPPLRPLTFSRYGGLGNHRAPIGFSGDVFQHELSLDFELRMTPVAANVMFGWISHDIGGFHADGTTVVGGACPGDSNPSNTTGAELFSRWLQFGALSPILRTHCGGCGPEGPPTCSCDRRIWEFPTHFQAMQDALRLRAMLLPYLYTQARVFYDTGVAPIRGMYIDYPSAAPAAAASASASPLAYEVPHQYSFGDALLAAPIHVFSHDGLSPVLSPTWLPEGAWVPWGGASAPTLSNGSRVDERWYGQTEVPLWASGNALIPLAASGTADIAKPSPAIAWTLWATNPPPTAGPGVGALYEDDGESQDYAKEGAGLRASAGFAWNGSGSGETGSPAASALLVVWVNSSTGGYVGEPSVRAREVHVRGWGISQGGDPSEVRVDGVAVPKGVGVVPGWEVVFAAPGTPQLTAPNSTLVVRGGEAPLRAPLLVEVFAPAAG